MIGQYPVVLTKQVWSIYSIRRILKRNKLVMQNFIPFALFLTGATWLLFALRFFAHLVELSLFVLYLFVCVMLFCLRYSIFFMR